MIDDPVRTDNYGTISIPLASYLCLFSPIPTQSSWSSLFLLICMVIGTNNYYETLHMITRSINDNGWYYRLPRIFVFFSPGPIPSCLTIMETIQIDDWIQYYNYVEEISCKQNVIVFMMWPGWYMVMQFQIGIHWIFTEKDIQSIRMNRCIRRGRK